MVLVPENTIETTTNEKMFNFGSTNWKLCNSILDADLHEVKIPNHNNMSPHDIDLALDQTNNNNNPPQK